MTESRGSNPGCAAQELKPFEWYNLLLVLSFGVAMALISHKYVSVGEVVVPTIFISSPTLFHVFVILHAFSFTASVIGLLLHEMNARINHFLSLFAFYAFMIALSIYAFFLLLGLLVRLPKA